MEIKIWQPWEQVDPAVDLGVVDRVVPLDLMPHAILHALRERSAGKTETAVTTK